MQDSTDQLIALLQARNTALIPITRDAVAFTNVTAVTGQTYNTTATLVPAPGSGFTDSKTITWNRVDLANVLDGSGLLADGNLTQQDVVDKVNANWATWLTLADLEDFAVPNTSDLEIHPLTLTARADSLGFYGSVTLSLSRPSMSVFDGLMSNTLPEAFKALS